ncbi:MAG: hypothetical protein IT374_24710 [Polyangiaceae bacterium]|nr:hypothetical protein [Polyangiaceae bacterium]
MSHAAADDHDDHDDAHDDAHHEPPPPPEGETPLWFTVLGVCLFTLGGILLLVTGDAPPAEKPEAPAKPAAAAAQPAVPPIPPAALSRILPNLRPGR